MRHLFYVLDYLCEWIYSEYIVLSELEEVRSFALLLEKESFKVDTVVLAVKKDSK